MMLLKLAWLNIWRNKRRTLITMASVFFAVFLAIAFRSMSDGVYENMVRGVVSYSSGYIQIHLRGYWDEQSIDNSFREDAALEQALAANPSVTQTMPRLESFGLASFGEQTKGVMLLGIDPEKEAAVNQLDAKITSGRYAHSREEPILMIGEGLAARMGTGVGDTLSLIGQGYHGTFAAGKYPVAGIVKLGAPELNNHVVYLPLTEAQRMHGADNRLTALSLMLARTANLEKVRASLAASADLDGYEVMSWKEMMPELDQFITVDSAGDYIFIGILYFIISFGLFSTLLMMTFERTREFGILLAIGMKRRLLALMLLLESIMISLMGCLGGVLAGILGVSWFIRHPIHFTGSLKEVYEQYGIEPVIYFSAHEKIFVIQALVVLGLALALTLYPGWKVMRLQPVEALNS